MTSRVSIVLACIWTCMVASTFAAEPRTEAKSASAQAMLVEYGEVAKLIDNPKSRFLDARSVDDFRKGHIPGAFQVTVTDWKNLAQTPGGLYNSKAWSKKIGDLGIDADTQVVVYGGKLSDAARIWWLLTYAGVEHVSLLNGSFNGWVAAGGKPSQVASKTKPTLFKPKFQADRLAEIDAIKASLDRKEIQVVDTRSGNEFAEGRVPGATHIEWSELVEEDGRFKSQKKLRALFGKRGIVFDAPAACYCRTGGRAAVDAFALELAGYPKVQVFVGGWTQWGGDEKTPKEK